jgi:hypothetical protein
MRTLDSSCDELVDRIQRLHPQSERRWGTMSAHEMLCHCSDLFRVALGEKDVPVKGALIHRTLMKWYAFYVPLRWPRNVRTLREVNPKKEGTSPGAFQADRAELVRLMDTLRAREGAFPPHPLFGALSRREWMRWGYLHTDHHLRQFGT